MSVTTSPNIPTSSVPPVSVNAIIAHVRETYRRFAPSRVVGKMTVDEWDDFLNTSKHKYHYIYGEVVQMAGASPEHNLIAMNSARAIRNVLEESNSGCETLGSDQRAHVRDNLYYFPDLVIVCGAMQINTRDALRNPVAIIEVLSPSTEIDDRTDKFREYQLIPSLQHYILIDQNRVAVTHYEKIAGGIWAILGDYRDVSDDLTLSLNEMPVTVSLSRIYQGLSFPGSVASTDEE